MLRSPFFHFFLVAIIAFMVKAVIDGGEEFSFLNQVATVKLSRAQLDAVTDRYLRDGALPDGAESEFLAATTDLVDQQLLYEEGIKLGIASEDTLIMDRMIKNIEFISSEKATEQDLAKRELTKEEFEKLMQEARELKLFENDPIIRRRVIQLTMQYIRESQKLQKPSDEELEAYLQAHRERFMLPPRWSFQQVFIDPKRHGEQIQEKLNQLARQIESSSAASELASLGDATILPKQVELATENHIVQQFGSQFFSKLKSTNVDEWVGPIESSFGYHYIKVTGKRAERVAELASVYNRVYIEWMNEKKASVYRDYIQDLRPRYRVAVEGYDAVPAPTFAVYWLKQINQNQL